MFKYPEIGKLDKKATYEAIALPAKQVGAKFKKEALEKIFNKTQGYPYFIQAWGDHCWKIAKTSTVTSSDVDAATVTAINELDKSFFKVRFQRCTRLEKSYLRAMAELGSGSQKSGEIAKIMHKQSQQVAPVRASLIKKGVIYSSEYGENNFTVPLFDEFMKRIMKYPF